MKECTRKRKTFFIRSLIQSNRLQRKPLAGGKIDWINLSILFLVFFFNLINQIHLDKSILGRIAYTSPFIIMIIMVLLFWGNHYFQSAIFLIIAIGTTLDPANISDYSGAIFFIYSFHLVKKTWYAGLISVVTISCLSVRSIIALDTVPGTLIIILVFGYIYAIYYFLIFKPMMNMPRMKVKNLSTEQNILLDHLGSGLIQKEAAVEMGIKHSEVADMVRKIKAETGYKTLPHLFREL